MKFKHAIFIGSFAICAQSYASDFSYNTLEFSIGVVQPSGEGDDGSGAGFSGTIEMGDYFYAGAGYSFVNFNDADQTVKTFGIGVHGSVGDKTDIYAQIGVVQADIDTDYEDFDDSGQGATLGVRFMAADTFEVNTGIEYTDVFDETDTAPFVGLHYYVNDSISLGFVLGLPEDATSYAISARANF